MEESPLKTEPDLVSPSAPTTAAPPLARTLPRRIWLRITAVMRAHPLVVDGAAVITVIASSAAVQLLYLQPPQPSDQMFYFYRAGEFPDPSIVEHKTLRIGLLLPVKVFQRLFGTSEAAYYAVPLLSGVLLVVATYAVGRLLFGRVIGVGAGAVIGLSPVFLLESSHLLPDIPSAALFATATWLVLVACRRIERHGTVHTGDQIALVFAGLLLGWAYLTREYLVFLFPLAAFIFWVHGVSFRRLVWVTVPVASVFVGEVALNTAVYGEPLARLTLTGGHSGSVPLGNTDRLDLLFRLPSGLAQFTSGPVLVMLLVLLLLAGFVRRRPFRIILAWFLLLWLPLTLLSGFVLDPELRFLRTHKIRYWFPLFPTVAIGGLAMVRHLMQGFLESETASPWVRRHGAPLAVGVMAFFVSWYGFQSIAESRRFRVNGADQIADLREWLREEGQDVDVLWTDDRTMHLLPLATNSTFGDPVWRGTMRSFQANDPDPFDDVAEFASKEEIDRGAIVIFNQGLAYLPEGRDSAPHYILYPEESEGWKRHEIDDQLQMVVYEKTTPNPGGSTAVGSSPSPRSSWR